MQRSIASTTHSPPGSGLKSAIRMRLPIQRPRQPQRARMISSELDWDTPCHKLLKTGHHRPYANATPRERVGGLPGPVPSGDGGGQPPAVRSPALPGPVAFQRLWTLVQHRLAEPSRASHSARRADQTTSWSTGRGGQLPDNESSDAGCEVA